MKLQTYYSTLGTNFELHPTGQIGYVLPEETACCQKELPGK
jgi:hypothetical protein